MIWILFYVFMWIYKKLWLIALDSYHDFIAWMPIATAEDL